MNFFSLAIFSSLISKDNINVVIKAQQSIPLLMNINVVIKLFKRVVLKSVYLRIFALSIYKEGRIRDFERWINNSQSWMIVLRRRLFGWKLHQWSNLCSILKGFTVSDSLKDSFIQKGSTNGRYSTSLHCKSVLNSEFANTELWKLVWTGLAPPKVEVFCWQLMRRKIVTKDQLARKWLMDRNLVVCAFCNKETESVDHLFFSCQFLWKIWMHYYFIWGLECVMHN